MKTNETKPCPGTYRERWYRSEDELKNVRGQLDELREELKTLTAQASIAANHCLRERGFSDFHAAIAAASAALSRCESGVGK